MNEIHEVDTSQAPLRSLLSQMPRRPERLWARGNLDLLTNLVNGVAIVGARASTAYGEERAMRFAIHLAGEQRRTVISGAAYGIDQAAHRAALAVGGATIAVLACGVDVPYPRSHADLLDQIGRDGLVLSAYPPGSPPNRQRFLDRNGLIAALATDMVVIEAGLRSGSMSAAHQAKEQGRRVWAMPGPVTSAQSAGCHHLIRTGMARIITEPEDLT